MKIIVGNNKIITRKELFIGKAERDMENLATGCIVGLTFLKF